MIKAEKNLLLRDAFQREKGRGGAMSASQSVTWDTH